MKLFNHLKTTTLTLALLLTSASVYADDGVLILPHGGTRALYSYEILPSSTSWTVQRRADTPIIPSSMSEDILSDIKVLPDQSILVAGFQQAPQDIIVRSEDAALTTLWTANNTFSTISAASVATASAPGSISRLLVADSNTSLIQLWDTSQELYLWRQSVSLSNTRSTFIQAIAMPENRIATASYSSSQNAWVIDIFNLSPEDEQPARFKLSSSPFASLTNADTVLGELSNLQDIFAIDASHLLVTTTSSLLLLDIDERNITWQIHTSDYAALNGQFSSATITPSGRIILASFEPGKWTEPHPNHQLHWFSLTASIDEKPQLIASSTALDRAPKRITSAQSTGGTGTLNFEGHSSSGTGQNSDIDAIIPGSVIDLNLTTIKQGQTFDATAYFSNPTNEVIVPPKLAIRGFMGSNCQAGAALLSFTLIESTPNPTISPLGLFALEGNYTVADDANPGTWCVFPAILDENETWVNFSQFSSKIQIVSKDGSSSGEIPVQELPLENYSDDMGYMPPTSQDMESRGDDVVIILDDPSTGCGGCAKTSKNTPTIPLEPLLFIIPMLGFARKRRSTR